MTKEEKILLKEHKEKEEKTVVIIDKAYRRVYYEDNKDKLKQYQKTYYKNKKKGLIKPNIKKRSRPWKTNQELKTYGTDEEYIISFD
jgi:hypothetical protein